MAAGGKPFQGNGDDRNGKAFGGKGDVRNGPGGPRPNSGPKTQEVTILKRKLIDNPEDIQETYNRMMQLVREGNIDAIRLRLGYAWGAVPQALKAEVSGDVTIKVVYDD